MIRFAVFDDAGPARTWPLRHAYLISREGYAAPATIQFEDGCIEAPRRSSDAVALALQYDAGDAGILTLQTCLLPPRERPYLLDLELARHRIMLVLNKLEEWSLTDLPTDHPVMASFARAQDSFTKALILGGAGSPPDIEQASHAATALQQAILASEDLAMLASDRDLAWRFTVEPPPEDPDNEDDDRPLLPAALGCTVHTDQFSEPLQQIIARSFEFIHCPMRWREVEREEGKYRFNLTDRWIEWAIRAGRKRVAAGPILDFSARSMPDWLYIWQHDYDAFREFAYEHVKRVVTRYRKTVSRWTIISGVNINQHFEFTLEQMLDLTRLAALLTRKLQPGAEIVVEIDQPFGEHAGAMRASVPSTFFAEMIRETGINIDALALRIQMGQGVLGRSTRDLAMVSDIIDWYASIGFPIHITALGAPSDVVRGDDENDSFNEPGQWRAPWSQTTQANWMTRALSIALSKRTVASVCWQSLFDTTSNPEMPAGGLITLDGRAKQSLRRITEISSTYHRQELLSTLPDMAADRAAPSQM